MTNAGRRGRQHMEKMNQPITCGAGSQWSSFQSIGLGPMAVAAAAAGAGLIGVP